MALAIFSMLGCDHIGEACRFAFSESTVSTHFKIHRNDYGRFRTKKIETDGGVWLERFGSY